FIPPTDIFETPATYNLEIALPGVAKENIDVEWVEDTKLVIKAHNKTAEASSSRPGSPKEGEKEGEKVNGGEEQEPPHKRRKYWLSERTIGEFVKEVQFPEDIDVESTSVRLDAGLLYVEVKKMEKRRRAKVEVE
ncbi:HSP20-like chaperone, partial [Ascobolus immersus RN42]